MKDWEKKKLGEVCIVERGSSPRPIEKYQTDSPDGVNWIKIGDTKGVDKYIFSTKEKITIEGAEKSRYVKEGDFILSNSMSFGKPFIMKTDGYIHDGWFVFRLPDYLDKDYFYYLLTSPNVQDQIQSLGAGAIVKNISGDLVKKVDVTYPKSISEQQRIVFILDKVAVAIGNAKANAEKNLENAKELFESYLQEVFENKGVGWEEKTLGEVAKTFGRGKSRHRPRNYEKLYGGDYPFIQTGDIRNCNHYITEYTQTYSELGLAQSKLWPSGTICITIAANIAETGVLTFDACFPDSVIGLVVNEKFADRDYIEYLLQSFKANLQELGKGAAQDNLNMGTFEKKLFPFPPVKIQKEIVQKLDALSVETKKLEAIYQQKINDLEELKKSVLQKAFSGELKMSEPLTSTD
jgi:type I restriction enzyme S subunit